MKKEQGNPTNAHTQEMNCCYYYCRKDNIYIYREKTNLNRG